jgi:transposase
MIDVTGGYRMPVCMKPYSNDLRDRVVAAMESGRSCREVGDQFGVAPSTAGDWQLPLN